MRFSLLTPLTRAWTRAGGALLLAFGLAVPLGGCSFLTGIPSVDHVDVTIVANPLTVGQQTVASGVAFTKGGDVIRNSRRQVTFSSSDPSVATIGTTNGLIVGLKPGVTEITGESGGKQDKVTLTVRLIPAKTVLILQRNPTYRVGAVNTISAVARDSIGNAIAGREIAYRSSDESILTVGAGIVTPKAVGTATIYATADNGAGVGSVTDSVVARVTVPPLSAIVISPSQATKSPGETQQLTVALTDSLNGTVTGRPVTWRSNNPNIATVDVSSGLVTAQAVGTAQITAELDCVPGEIRRCTSPTATTINVVPAPIDRVNLSTSTITVRVGNASSTTVTVLDANGQRLAGRVVDIDEADEAIAQAGASSISSSTSGTSVTIVGKTQGTTTITFQGKENGVSKGTPATLTVTVVP